MSGTEIYRPKHHIRFVTASSLFDGHDASINIMRRILQASGAEVIHLGHNRSVEEVVNAAIQEDAQGIAISSYQGGHVEYFKYMYDLLKEKGAPEIRIYGGGGGVIIPREIKELHEYGIARIFSPEDGRKLGLQGMINRMLEECDFQTASFETAERIETLSSSDVNAVAKLITLAELHVDQQGEAAVALDAVLEKIKSVPHQIPVVGITGTGGAGKSSLTDELIRRFLNEIPEKRVAVLSVDPTKQKTGGALLGDRIRMNAIFDSRVFMRSLATRLSKNELSLAIRDAVSVVKAAGFDLVIVETSGIGQGDAEITEICDVSLYVMTSEFGAPSQLEKIDMMDFADLIVINKFERKGSEDAKNQVQKQYQRSRMLFEKELSDMPVYGTIASQFNDPGTNGLFAALIETINNKTGLGWQTSFSKDVHVEKQNVIIPNDRRYYLREISDTVRRYHQKAEEQTDFARKLFQLDGALALVKEQGASEDVLSSLEDIAESTKAKLSERSKAILEGWEQKKANYQGEYFVTRIRDKEILTASSRKAYRV